MYQLLTVQDISCYGKCSIALSLPVLSAMGISVSVLPVAVFSTHTGYEGAYEKSLSASLSSIIRHWRSQNIHFDGIYLGYLSSAASEASFRKTILRLLKDNRGASLYLDPAMADNGKVYRGMEGEETVAFYRDLMRKSELVLPNLTEACLLAGVPYENAIPEVVLNKLDCRQAVITGLNASRGHVMERRIRILYEGTDATPREYITERMPGYYHGAGDLFSSVVIGCLCREMPLGRAVEIAAEFTLDCVRKTMLEVPADAQGNHYSGLIFEPEIPSLLSRLKSGLKSGLTF